MATKKTRRMRKPSVPMSNGRTVPADVEEPAAPARPDWPSASRPAPQPKAWPTARAGAAAGRGANQVGGANWQDDYRYVTRDLRRIGMLAGGIVAVLVALSFIIK